MAKKTRTNSSALKQTTLLTFNKRKPPLTGKRTRAEATPIVELTDSEDAQQNDNSDVAAIRFEPKQGSTKNILSSDESDNMPAYHRRNKIKSSPIPSDDDNSESPPKKKRKLVKGARPAVIQDEESSGDDVDQDKILDSRLRKRGLTKFQKNLEKLKRKKLGQVSESSDSENDNEEHEIETTTPFRGARPSRLDADDDDEADSDSEASQEDDFIVLDDGPAVDLPTEFSMNTYQDLVHHFKVIVQFFVHIAVQPPGERRQFMDNMMKNDKYFSVPLQIARRQISGLRDSLVTSSVWRPDFKNRLTSLPELEVTPLEVSVYSCDACHLSGRVSTLVGRLGGRPYDSVGFEPKSPESSSDDDSSDEEHSEIYLGRFCAKRTRVFHDISHWEYTLFQTLVLEIQEITTHSGFVRVSHDDGIKPPEDLTDADALCEWLDQRKVIEIEWQKLEYMMESARHLDAAAKRGENDD